LRQAAPAPLPKLLRPVAVAEPSERPLLVYFPGSDGTGCSIAPQLQGLLDAGWDVRCALRAARVCLLLPPS
jgi:hypothetical protein